MAESILRKDGAENFRAFSAGSMPTGRVNAVALKVLDGFGYPTDSLVSKSWEVFTASDAPYLDFVFTVCDAAAGETCPLWPGRPITAHWGIEDPSAVNGGDTEKERAFVAAFRHLRHRISLFTSLPIASLGNSGLSARLGDIGRSQRTTSKS